MHLKDKIAIVTGGDTGIGKAICLACAREGASVVIDYHGDAAPATALVEEIENLGARAIAVEANVADPEEVESLIAAAVNAFGGVDILVNNAGIEQKHPFLETPFELFRKVIDINLGGVWLCTQAAAKQMVKQKRGGRIVNISSVHEELADADQRAILRGKRRGPHADAHGSAGTREGAYHGERRRTRRRRYADGRRPQGKQERIPGAARRDSARANGKARRDCRPRAYSWPPRRRHILPAPPT